MGKKCRQQECPYHNGTDEFTLLLCLVIECQGLVDGTKFRTDSSRFLLDAGGVDFMKEATEGIAESEQAFFPAVRVDSFPFEQADLCIYDCNHGLGTGHGIFDCRCPIKGVTRAATVFIDDVEGSSRYAV